MSEERAQGKLKIGITVGDYNGIGPEVIIKTYRNQAMLDYGVPVLYGSSKVLSFYKNQLDLDDFSFFSVDDVTKINKSRLNLIQCWNEDAAIEPGKLDPIAGKCAFEAIKKSVDDLLEKKIDVLITAPVNKSTITSHRKDFNGHTGYIAKRCDAKEHLMLMTDENICVGVATEHIALQKVSSSISTEGIFNKLKIMNKAISQDLGKRKPRIAVLALNPHAGEDGSYGSEEKDIIEPAIKKANDENMLVFGPYPADSFFGSGQHHSFQGILAMYHDQGLIPFKQMAFNSGVNFTAGLPIIRTSPDHGTAMGIAGQNCASEKSFREAVFLACDVYKRRKEN